ncbi:MAG: trimeric autotransporter adhesin [Gaiellaceae bacterium]|jgi:hypothetical protein|nr:trimeric autotransporter adhesin [Gaiellaceae bacterium]
MLRSPRLRPAARVLIVLALILALGALLAGQGAASTKDAVPPPYDQSDSFWSWPGSVLLHVSVSPAEATAGYVVSDPYYIDCPWACTRPYDAGSTVVLTAYPTNGFTFTSWSGDACAGQGNPCTLTMTANTLVTANFSGSYVPREVPSTPAGRYTLTVHPTGDPWSSITSDIGGINCTDFGVIGTCSASYPAGTHVSLSANPFIIFSIFGGWSGSATGSANPLDVTMNGNKYITASFFFGCIC